MGIRTKRQTICNQKVFRNMYIYFSFSYCQEKKSLLIYFLTFTLARIYTNIIEHIQYTQDAPTNMATKIYNTLYNKVTVSVCLCISKDLAKR